MHNSIETSTENQDFVNRKVGRWHLEYGRSNGCDPLKTVGFTEWNESRPFRFEGPMQTKTFERVETNDGEHH